MTSSPDIFLSYNREDAKVAPATWLTMATKT